MISNKNIETFNKWALLGKDKNMQDGHLKSVNEMMKIVNKSHIMSNAFNFVDLGCGNGWVVRKFSKKNLCKLAVGVDGSSNMINKAKLFSDKEIYI